jgi:hypothetical protein
MSSLKCAWGEGGRHRYKVRKIEGRRAPSVRTTRRPRRSQQKSKVAFEEQHEKYYEDFHTARAPATFA